MIFRVRYSPFYGFPPYVVEVNVGESEWMPVDDVFANGIWCRAEYRWSGILKAYWLSWFGKTRASLIQPGTVVWSSSRDV